jgi:hypothetical protein
MLARLGDVLYWAGSGIAVVLLARRCSSLPLALTRLRLRPRLPRKGSALPVG